MATAEPPANIDTLAPVRRLVADLRGYRHSELLEADLQAVERWLISPQSPAAIAHGWYARSWDGRVYEVWLYGNGSAWLWVDSDGQTQLTVAGDLPSATSTNSIKPTKAAAIDHALVEADAKLTSARAAVDNLRAELARA